MHGYLSKPKIDYVLLHLGHHFQSSGELTNAFRFRHGTSSPTMDSSAPEIVFTLLAGEYNEQRVRWIDLQPVLFPASDNSAWYFFDADGNLIFPHDLLKSAFYLLSGYQETRSTQRDQLGRFPFEASVQHKLGFVARPLVNYYFEQILEGLEAYALRHKLSFSRRRLFDTFGFLLSHDVDHVDYYTRNHFLYKIKEALRLVPGKLSPLTNMRLAVTGFFKYVTKSKDNPYWNFEFLRSVERSSKLQSTFYFLDQGVKNSDAAYSFDEPRIRGLFKQLTEERCEIGLHGTVRSSTDAGVLKSNLDALESAASIRIAGSRQHRLLWDHPRTALIHQSCGLRYDSTLGFAQHEGFRNSYCYPFRLYDFDKDAPIDLWEFPLVVMDVTLFVYRALSLEQAHTNYRKLIEEVSKFGGIFTVLWHNSFFDEVTYTGITNFYKTLLSTAAAGENLTAASLLEMINNKWKDSTSYE